MNTIYVAFNGVCVLEGYCKYYSTAINWCFNNGLTWDNIYEDMLDSVSEVTGIPWTKENWQDLVRLLPQKDFNRIFEGWFSIYTAELLD